MWPEWKHNYDEFKPCPIGFRYVLPPVNELSKQKRTMQRLMRKPCELKVRFYNYCMVDINEYLTLFPGVKASDKIGDMEKNLSTPN